MSNSGTNAKQVRERKLVPRRVGHVGSKGLRNSFELNREKSSP
jgi:hypothetical protein